MWLYGIKFLDVENNTMAGTRIMTLLTMVTRTRKEKVGDIKNTEIGAIPVKMMVLPLDLPQSSMKCTTSP